MWCTYFSLMVNKREHLMSYWPPYPLMSNRTLTDLRSNRTIVAPLRSNWTIVEPLSQLLHNNKWSNNHQDNEANHMQVSDPHGDFKYAHDVESSRSIRSSSDNVAGVAIAMVVVQWMDVCRSSLNSKGSQCYRSVGKTLRGPTRPNDSLYLNT